jgi:sarcosine oxidase
VNTWDVIVIGAGAVGSAAMRAASESGARVLGLEQSTPANIRGSSHGHSRIFRHAYFEHPDYVPLLLHATSRFESLEVECGTRLLHRCGMLLMGPPDSSVVGGALESARCWGLEVEAHDAAAVRTRFPWFDVPDDTCAAFEANAGVVRPEAAVHAALQAAAARGAELRTGVRVLALDEDASGVTIRTDGGTLRAAGVIVAAGPWAGRLLPELAPLLRVTRQVQAWFVATAGVDSAAMPCWLLDRGPAQAALYGLAPDPLAATSAEAATSPARYAKAALHGSDDVVDPDVGAAAVTADDIERISKPYRAIAPALAGPLAGAATCLYTMSPDQHFLVGTRRGCSRTHYAAGLSGHGFKLAPALGDALADLALLGRTRLPVGFLAPARFGV